MGDKVVLVGDNSDIVVFLEIFFSVEADDLGNFVNLGSYMGEGV